MERRTFLTALLASPALLAVLQACGSDDAASTTSTSPKSPAGVARSSKARVQTSVTDASQATSVVNGFGVDMYTRLTADSPPPNLVFSPASIAIALAMTRAGAKGTTGTEMDNVLHVADADSLPRSMNALSTALGSRTKKVKLDQDHDVDVTLSIANSLWAQQDLDFETAFLDVLASEYGAELQLVDYAADPDGARKLINAWIDDATNDRIPELLPPGVITAQARLTLVNAIYMKAPWQYDFDKESTSPAAFTTLTGSAVQAPTMTLSKRLDYAHGSGWQAVVLPYLGRDLSMVIALPDADAPLATAVAAIAGVGTAATTELINLALPKFDIETATGLAGVLSAMGMPTAFSDSADFSGMTTAARLFISAVVHQANITVDESGTEAAAATAVIAEATAAPQPTTPIDFVADHPFAFAIRDNESGAMLFLGHVGDDPRLAKAPSVRRALGPHRRDEPRTLPRCGRGDADSSRSRRSRRRLDRR